MLTQLELEEKIKLGISSCLLGNNVRWNGGHQRDRYLVETLGQFVEWVPVCPEVEVGLGIPRETLRLVGDADNPRPPVEGSNFTAQFNRLPDLPSGTVTGQTGCNTYNATYTANLQELKINLPAKTNNDACPWGTGNFEVEQQFFLGLNSATSYRIIGNVLQILYGEPENLQVLSFVASQPPAAGPAAGRGGHPFRSLRLDKRTAA